MTYAMAGLGPVDDTEPSTDGQEPAPSPVEVGRTGWWRRFRRHRLAMLGLIVTILIYLVALLADFVAPHSPTDMDADRSYAPPQTWVWQQEQPDGSTAFGPAVLGYTLTVDPESLKPSYAVNPDDVIALGFFTRSEPYHLLGVIPMDRVLFGPVDPEERVYLLGADRNGRDVLSRIIHGTQISMTIGLAGVALAFVLGLVLGGISGYVGGWVDTGIQRVIELFMSIPTLPLWLGLAAALPDYWTAMQRYLAITVILAIIAWTELARVVRGKLLSVRREDYVVAAALDGNGPGRIVGRHMLPSLMSHLIASLTLTIPAMILAETSLSFLGLGLQAPAVSWGVLLQEAQNIRTVSTAPWLMAPGVAVIIAVLSLNFIGDGLRDAADPYST